MNDEQLKGLIIRMTNQALSQFKDPEKTPADIVVFLSGLTKAKIKAAVKKAIQEERAKKEEQQADQIARYDEAIAAIDAL